MNTRSVYFKSRESQREVPEAALCTAIIQIAVVDYCRAHYNPTYRHHAELRKELDEFFSSEWFEALADLLQMDAFIMRKRLPDIVTNYRRNGTARYDHTPTFEYLCRSCDISWKLAHIKSAEHNTQMEIAHDSCATCKSIKSRNGKYRKHVHITCPMCEGALEKYEVPAPTS